VIPPPKVEESTLRPIPPNPCVPSPCGPNSVCQVASSGEAQCACQDKMIGTAPNCRPECLVSSDCRVDRACVNQICVDPCPGTCATNAECRVVQHSPVCSCREGFEGNGFDQCRTPVTVGKIFMDLKEDKLLKFFIGKTALFMDLWCHGFGSSITQTSFHFRLFPVRF